MSDPGFNYVKTTAASRRARTMVRFLHVSVKVHPPYTDKDGKHHEAWSEPGKTARRQSAKPKRPGRTRRITHTYELRIANAKASKRDDVPTPAGQRPGRDPWG